VNYIELKYPKPADEIISDLLVSDLGELGFESFAEEDQFLAAYIPEKNFLLENLFALVPLKKFYDDGALEINLIEDRNWNAVWESNYPPVLIANRCFVRAPFHEPDPKAEFNILIKPKMAFGTAHHETTELMTELLLETEVAGKTVLDMGCGTGVLAILASMKRAEKITAIDFDEWAFKNSLENVEANKIENIEVLMGDSGKIDTSERFHLILANINKNTLLNDLPVYASALKRGGKLFLSGFYDVDLKDISNKANEIGLIFDSSRTKNKWTAAVYLKQ
jgi:ribosomal protein L11 methyltransferase